MSGVENALAMEFSLTAGDFNGAGDASGKIKRTLQQVGVKADVIRRIAISAYEAELNVIIHSTGGEIKARIYPDRTELEIVDCGPGIEDVELAMKEGFSTAPDHIREMGFGAGMGLPNMARCADKFAIESKPGLGTRLNIVINH